MRLNEGVIEFEEGLSVNLDEVKTLKALNDRLLFVMEGSVVIEISGLSPKMVDAAFIAYSRHLREVHPVGIDT